MTFWRYFRTEPFVTAVVLGVLMTTWAGSTQAQEPKGDAMRSRQGTLIYKSITRDIEARAAAQQRAEEESRDTTAAQPLVAPANDNFAKAIALQGQQGSVSGTNVDATAEPDEPAPSDPGFVGGSSVWYTFTPAQTGLTFVDTFGSNFDTVLAVYTGEQVDALSEVDSNDQAAGTDQSRIAFIAQAGVTYSIAVDGFQGAEGNFTLNFERTDQLAPENDDFEDAIALQGQQGSVSGDNFGASAEPGEPAPSDPGFVGGSSVWYTFTPDQTGITFVDTFGSDFDTVLAVYTGNTVDALTEVASDDDAQEVGGPSRVVFLAQAGVTYSIAVDGFLGDQGNFTLNFERTDQLAPENDDFDDAITLQGQQDSVFGFNIGATAEPGEPAHAGIGAFSSVWYTYTPDVTGVVFFDTFGSDFDTVLAVYTGNQVDALTEVTSNDDANDFSGESRVGFLAQQGVTYRIAVDGFQGAEGGFTLNFRQTDQLPPANDDFDDAIALEGDDGELNGNNVVATPEPGEPPHSFFGSNGNSVWYTLTSGRTRVVELRVSSRGDVSPILAPTIAVYEGASVDALVEVAKSDDAVFDNLDSFSEGTLPLAFLAEAGVTYRIAVDTAFEGGGGRFTLAFDRANRLPPDNDDFEDAIVLEGRRGSVTGSNAGATRQPNEFGLFDGTTRSVWYSFTSDQTRIVTFDTFGSDFDTVLFVYDDPALGDFEIARNDDANNGRQSEVAFLAQSGVTYQIRVDGFNNDRGDFTLNFERSRRDSPANDDFANARRLSGSSGIVSGLNVNASVQPNEPVPFQGGSSVWWRWRAPFTGDVTFATAGSNFDTVLAVYQGPRLTALMEIASNDDTVLLNDVIIRESLVTFEAEEGQLYHILVDGFAGEQGSINLAWTPGDALLKRGVDPGKEPPEGRDEDGGK